MEVNQSLALYTGWGMLNETMIGISFGINNLEVPFSLALIIQEGISLYGEPKPYCDTCHLVGLGINNLEVPFRLAFIIQEGILIFHYFVLGTLQREMKLD